MTVLCDDGALFMTICRKCHRSQQVLSRVDCCPMCFSKVTEIRMVSCAHIDHNEPKGCGNPKCWKYGAKR